MTTGLVHADDGKGVTVALHAAEAAGRSGLGHIDTIGGKCAAEQGNADDESKNEVHFD